MGMQVRIKNADGSNITVLENADNKVLSETLNSGNETFIFEIPKNDPKAYLLNPEKSSRRINLDNAGFEQGTTTNWSVYDPGDNGVFAVETMTLGMTIGTGQYKGVLRRDSYNGSTGLFAYFPSPLTGAPCSPGDIVDVSVLMRTADSGKASLGMGFYRSDNSYITNVYVTPQEILNRRVYFRYTAPAETAYVIMEIFDWASSGFPHYITFDDASITITPGYYGYAMLWEVWDTATNTRLNTGPITSITAGSSGTWRIEGKGRSAFLEDIIDSRQTFYAPLDKLVDDLRYENVAIQPRTKTMIHSRSSTNTEEDTFFVDEFFDSSVVLSTGTVLYDAHYNLSNYTKNFAIDDDNGFIAYGKEEPSRSFYTASKFWAGMGPQDSLVVDLGEPMNIAKVKLLFPWWGGPARAMDRSFEFELAHATDGTTLDVQGRSTSAFTPLYRTTYPNRLVTIPNYDMEFYLGATLSGHGYGFNRYNVANNVAGPVSLRYIRVYINRVNAWYGSAYDDDAAYDGYRYQCDPSYRPGQDSHFGDKLGLMTYRKKNGTIVEKRINDQQLTATADCYASIVELGIFKEIVPKYKISPLVLQRIDNNNLQITYSHTAAASETKNTYMVSYDDDDEPETPTTALRKFEPGTFFRNFKVTYSRASGKAGYHRFFRKDCYPCYANDFQFGIVDHNSNAIYLTDTLSATNLAVKAGIFTKHILMKGAGNAVVTWCDAWKGQENKLSIGGSYSYTETAGDTATLHFRGKSLKWYATIPAGKAGATVKIEKRQKSPDWATEYKTSIGKTVIAANSWLPWTTLEASYKLPERVSGEVVYEIPYGSSLLQDDTVYEIRITTLDTGYCSIDAFEGYWYGSFTMYNEDSTKIRLSNEDAFKQLTNGKYQAGSMYKWNKAGAGVSMVFEGDRVIVLSARGNYHGKLRLALYRYNKTMGLYDPGVQEHVFIPGGNTTDGSITLQLNTGKHGYESTQHVIFDSNESFPNGLTWGTYAVTIAYKDVETYTTTKKALESENFVYRCSNCDDDLSGSTTTNRYVYLDAIGVHEKVGISATFDNKTHLEQLKSLAEICNAEWQVVEQGLQFEPFVGSDTDYYLREGENTLVDYNITYDVQKVASMLLSYGSDIQGMPLYTVTEDFINKKILQRTVMKQNDFREVGSYNELIGLSRGELKRRRTPEKRISITHTAKNLPLKKGDRFNLYSKQLGLIRLRVDTIERTESSTAGTQFQLECVKWPQMD